jgi:hypothetical protein
MSSYAAGRSPISPVTPDGAYHHGLPNSHTLVPGHNGAAGVGSAAAQAAANAAQHKRVYQACIPCRRRKVRCDLGSVDNPHDPPCVRCRRESKECFFSATRRKRKTDDVGDEYDDEVAVPDVDEYTARNGRKRQNAGDNGLGATFTNSAASRYDSKLYSDVPLTPGGSQGRLQPLRRPDGGELARGGSAGRDAAAHRPRYSDASVGLVSGEPNTPLENFEAREVMRREVYGPHDALDLLYKAATDDHKELHGGAAGPSQPGLLSRHSDTSVHKLNSHLEGGYGGRANSQAPNIMDQPIDPALTTGLDPATEAGYAEALHAWSRFRFVRAGWFTAQEAIAYIDYYYEFLSPLTPISPPTFHTRGSHTMLLTEEPILTVTLLTIASRYRKMPGTGGECRSYAIHEQLWTHLRGMIERVFWGQEAFGGGYAVAGTGPGDEITSSTAPWRGLRKGSLRTLGTIESLLILTEWHPRALHFPPAEAIDELFLPPYESKEEPLGDDNGPRPTAGIGGKRIESWLEPAWRSDRMCWMLLSTALGLAYELGVFDDIDELLAAGAITRPEYEDEGYRLRAHRIKRLLLIYLSQLAGRLGWTNMVPEQLRRSEANSGRKRPNSSLEGTTPGTNPSSLSGAFNYIPDLDLDDQIIHCWAGISTVMHSGNERLFKSRKHTTEIIQNNNYINLLKDFQPMLKAWYKEFERFRLPPYIRHILTIEYEYVRIYVNSLSLQAVVERCTNNAEKTANAGSVSGNSAAQLSPQTQNYYGKLPLGQLGGFTAEDQEYVNEVVDGSRNLLRTVVQGLLPGDYLKHAPVRTYFRIISGAMFLLKTFALGAKKSDVELSISLMDQTVEALRNCVVDDVHLGIRFADLLESLTSRLRNRFIHAPPVPATEANGDVAEVGNANGTNGDGVASGDVNAQGWAKLRDGAAGLGTSPALYLLLVNGPCNRLILIIDPLTDRSGTPVNISATPFEYGNFPYPTGSNSMFGPSTPAATAGGMQDANATASAANGNMSDMLESADWNSSGNEVWYLPPGPQFYADMGNSAVAMTAEGVNVGGLDLLDFMAMDSYPNVDGNGNAFQ